MERGGKVLTEAEKKAMYDEIKATYDAQADPRYGAARGWVDAIIDPVETRECVDGGAGGDCLNPEVGRFNVGVLQT